jgi:hypothetical protein
MMAGGAIGAGIGGAGDAFLGGTGDARKMMFDSTDTAARFGDFGQLQNLEFDALKGADRSGYSTQETLSLIDNLRSARVIDDSYDGADKELVAQLQELTRATGLNTEALTQSFATYRNLGGKDNPRDYMGQVVAGAVDTGFKANIQQYQDMMGSASQQLAYSSVSADTDGSTMQAVQGAMKGLMGGDSSTAALLRDNRALGGAVLNDFMSKGGAQQYSYDSAAMQIAGIDSAKTDATYNTGADRVRNAAMRYGAVAQNVFDGDDKGIIKQNLQNDPEYLNKLISGSKGRQDELNAYFKAQFGHDPSAAEFKTFTEVAANQIKNDGVIDLGVKGGDGKTMAQAIEESSKTEAEKAREAAQSRHDAMMDIMDDFKTSLTGIDQIMANILNELKSGIDMLRNIYSLVEPIISPILSFMGKDAKPVDTSGGLFAEQKPRSDNLFGGKMPDGLFSKADPKSIGFKPVEVQSIDDLLGKTSLTPTDLGRFADTAKLSSIAELTVPGATMNQFTKGLDSGLFGSSPLPHARFKDTPPGGIVSQPGMDTFGFEHGDLIFASASGSSPYSGSTTTEDMRGGGMTYSPTINIYADRDSNVTAIAAEVKAALSQSADAFTAQWDSNRSAGGGGRVASNYG